MMPHPMHDMHCHLDFMANGEEVAQRALSAGVLLFANTTDPDGWQGAIDRFARFPNVRIGFGMHPWWVQAPEAPGDEARLAESQRAEHRRLLQIAEDARGDDELSQAQRARITALLDECRPRIIGEIGLDLSWRHAHSRWQQLRMLEEIALWAGNAGGRLVSLHSVQAAAETLGILENAGALESCSCIFHWFTGPSDQLKRAIQAGCYFSCGPRMLATKKGREYVKAIPADRLLLETDAPPAQGSVYSYEELLANLQEAADAIAAIKGEGALARIAETSRILLGDAR